MGGLNLNHKNLDVWQKAIDLVAATYRITNTFPKEEMYGLTNQLRRAAVSIPSNIAEGASRSSYKERRRFYEIARSSLSEVDTQFEICYRLNYLKKNELGYFEEQMHYIFAMLSNLIKRTGRL